MTNKDLVLQCVERCKALAPIMQGIEPDASFDPAGNLWTSENFLTMGNRGSKHLPPFEFIKDWIPTFRQDKLALRLPEWVFDNFKGIPPNPLIICEIEDKIDLIHKVSKVVVFGKGQPQLEATADLLILLNNEGLL